MKKRFFALLLCLALCLSLIPAAAAAEITLVPPPADESARIVASGSCGSRLRWDLDDQGTLTISGSGKMDDFSANQPWYSYRSDIKAVVVGDQATSIGGSAFLRHDKLERVTLGSGVTSIGEYAFLQCTSLQSVTFGSGLKEIGHAAFVTCISLESVTIPDGVTTVGENAFDSCENLQSVTFGSGVTGIGQRAFYGCCSLQEVVFRGEAPEINSNVFQRDALVARYPAGDASWTDSVRQGCGGFILWVPDDGPRITLTAYDTANYDGAHFYDGGTLSDGVCAFTLASENDRAALVAVKDGDAYTRLPCTTDADKVHRFTLTVNGDTELVLALMGDVNLDGLLKGTDGTMLKRAVLGSYSYPADLKGLCELVADLNGDGVIKGSEGTQIARAVLGTHTIKW